MCGVPSPLQVCWKCRATKGSVDVSRCYTNVSPTAAWKNDPIDDPWTTMPAFAGLRAFSVNMLGLDVLHVWHLGVGRDLAGTAMKQLLRNGYFGDTIESGLARATSLCKAWAKQQKHTLAMKRFTKGNLNWSSDFPELRTKGYDTYIVLSWLASELSSRDCGLPDLQLLVCVSDVILRGVNEAGMFLTEEEVQQKQLLGEAFVRVYVKCAAENINQRLYRMRPKFHLWHHLLEESRPSRLNPRHTSTWMDEDWVKRVMKVTRNTHRRTSTQMCLRRWLLGLNTKFESAVARL